MRNNDYGLRDFRGKYARTREALPEFSAAVKAGKEDADAAIEPALSRLRKLWEY